MLEWTFYKDQFSTAEMRQIWSEKETVSAWLKTEQIIAACQADMKLIPAGAATALGRVGVDDVDFKRLTADMALVGRPIVGLVSQLRQRVGEAHGEYVHFGTTTQDIMDTGLALQMRGGLEIINSHVDGIIAQLNGMAESHNNTPTIGRTNGQYAIPMTFGSKLQLWSAELNRRKASIADAANRGLLVQFGGPVGDLSFYGDDGPALKRAIAEACHLGFTEPHWQNARDGLAEIIGALGLLCATLCKIAHNINILSSSDIGELHEAAAKGKGASSAMKHKQNQRCSEFGEAVARLGRQRAEQINETSMHQHERSGGMWIAEWVIVPQVFLLSSGALHWIGSLFQNLEIDSTRMALNLQTHLDTLNRP